MFCSKCGQEMPDSAEFCPKCGWKARNESSGTVSIKVLRKSKHTKKKIIKTLVISCVAVLVCVCVAGVSLLEREYQSAMRKYESGDYSGAYSGFSQDKLKYYRNSQKMMKKICPYEAGDIVTFGTYEQDGDLSNGPEPIEWVITYHSNDMGYAMVSKYCIDSVKCNDTAEFVDWKKSIPYNWLNDFYKNSFSVDEKELISKFEDIYYTSHFQCTDYAALASADLWHGWSWSEGVEETYYHTTATEYAKTKIATNGTYACWWNGYDLPLIEGTVYGTNVVDAPDSVTEHPANYENAGIRPVIFVKFGLYGED